MYYPHSHNNGRIYLSYRKARRMLGRAGDEEIANWYRELQHYGFIVQTQGPQLGVKGRGLSTHWRLTELGFMKDPPTRDFERWDGVKFKARRRLSRSRKAEARPAMAARPAPPKRDTTAPPRPGSSEPDPTAKAVHTGDPDQSAKAMHSLLPPLRPVEAGDAESVATLMRTHHD
jgi:hypothetical protein